MVLDRRLRTIAGARPFIGCRVEGGGSKGGLPHSTSLANLGPIKDWQLALLTQSTCKRAIINSYYLFYSSHRQRYIEPQVQSLSLVRYPNNLKPLKIIIRLGTKHNYYAYILLYNYQETTILITILYI